MIDVNFPAKHCWQCDQWYEGHENDHNCMGAVTMNETSGHVKLSFIGSMRELAQEWFGDPDSEVSIRYQLAQNRWVGSVPITRLEVESCEDRRALRRLVSAKLQPLGDALLAALEKVCGERAVGDAGS